MSVVHLQDSFLFNRFRPEADCTSGVVNPPVRFRIVQPTVLDRGPVIE